MDDILNKIQTNEVDSRMTKRSTVISFDGTQRNGATDYIGAPSSDFRVRIYDKALEQGEPGHWVRVELVMGSKNANAFVEQIGNWVEAQVGPSLAILFQTMGWPYIFELAKDSAKRLSDKQISLVTDYNSLQLARGVV